MAIRWKHRHSRSVFSLQATRFSSSRIRRRYAIATCPQDVAPTNPSVRTFSDLKGLADRRDLGTFPLDVGGENLSDLGSRVLALISTLQCVFEPSPNQEIVMPDVASAAATAIVLVHGGFVDRAGLADVYQIFK